MSNGDLETRTLDIQDMGSNSVTESSRLNATNGNSGSQFNDIDLDISQLTFNPEISAYGEFTINDVHRHDTRDDCYLIISDKVYNVSGYISHHPGGARTITSRCGTEVSGIFARIHSNRAWDLLEKYKVGTISTNKTDTTPRILEAIEGALKDANPDVDIIKIIPKQHFYVAKLVFNKKLYEIHISDSGNIIKEEVEDDESDWSMWKNDRDDK